MAINKTKRSDYLISTNRYGDIVIWHHTKNCATSSGVIHADDSGIINATDVCGWITEHEDQCHKAQQ